MSNKYEQAIIAVRVSSPGNAPFDINNQPCSISGRRQAIMILEGEENPDPSKYEILDTFSEGEKVDGFETVILNSTKCKPDVYEFEADKLTLSYGVSYQGLGFNFNDSVQVTSSLNESYISYAVTSKPDWVLTATLGTTSGIVNTLNLVVDRNRTDDNDRSGNILLTQNETGATFTIAITQKGRLTEGTPTEYPYVGEDTILNKPYPVVQLGEQIWMQEPLKDGAMISQEVIDNWATSYPNKYTPTKAEFDEVYVSGWTKIKKNEIQGELESEAGGADIYHHMLPLEDDVLELCGFIVANTGSTDWNNFKQGALGVCVTKKVLDIITNGYDDVRQSYPTTWIDALNNGKVTDTEIKTGSDIYAIGFKTPGVMQAFGKGGPTNNPIYGCMQFHSRGQDPANSNDVLIFGYSLSEDHNKRGIYRREERTTYIAKNIRTIRYRELPFELYTDATNDTDGTAIIRINKGDIVPNGFTILSKGSRRGLYLGNNNLSFETIKNMSGWVSAYINNTGGGIG